MYEFIAHHPWAGTALSIFSIVWVVAMIVGAGALIVFAAIEVGLRRTFKGLCEVLAALVLGGVLFKVAPDVVKELYRSRPATPETTSLAGFLVLLSASLFWFRRRMRFFYGVLEVILGLAILWIAIPVQFDDPRIGRTSEADDIAAIGKLIAALYVLVRGYESLEIGARDERSTMADRADTAARTLTNVSHVPAAVEPGAAEPAAAEPATAEPAPAAATIGDGATGPNDARNPPRNS